MWRGVRHRLSLTMPYRANGCRPNCFAHCEAGTLRLRALCDIEAGAELTISYLPIDTAFMQRRNELQNSYFFDVAPSVCTLARTLT